MHSFTWPLLYTYICIYIYGTYKEKKFLYYKPLRKCKYCRQETEENCLPTLKYDLFYSFFFLLFSVLVQIEISF